MWYLKSAFEAYQNVQSSLQTRLNQMQSAALSPLQMVRSFLQSTGGEKSDDPSEEVQELQRRLAQLEAQQQPPKAANRRSQAAEEARSPENIIFHCSRPAHIFLCASPSTSATRQAAFVPLFLPQARGTRQGRRRAGGLRLICDAPRMNIETPGSEVRYVGQPLRRREDVRFLRGKGLFVDDVAPPGTAWCAFVRSPHGHARIRGVSTMIAAGMPGVLCTLTAEDWRRAGHGEATAVHPMPFRRPADEQCAAAAFAGDKVRHVGDIVAAVVAFSQPPSCPSRRRD